MRRVPLRARLALAYAAALVAVLAVSAAIVLWQQRRIGLRRVDRELTGLSVTLTNVLHDELDENADVTRAAERTRNLVTGPGRALAIIDAHGTVLAARWNGLELPPDAAPDGDQVTTVETAHGAWRVHRHLQTLGDVTLALLVASPVTDIRREQREAEEAMMIGIPIILLVAAGGGIYLSSLSVRPIAEALRVQRQFTADASHELRTPVSIVRATADVTLGREHRDESEYREALAIVGGQARRLGRLVEDLLVLARADAGGYSLQPVDLYFDEIVAECRRAVSVLAAERGVTIRVALLPEVPFRGDEHLLRQLVLNVLQNAVQHTPAGGAVGIDLQRDASAVTVRISNSGAPIPAEDRQRIFDRFVQLDPARRGEGAGLGLPIARWIAEAHRGTLTLERTGPDGTIFCLTLPTRAEASLPAPARRQELQSPFHLRKERIAGPMEDA
jgi:signal transduction histidine kinase